ncbi:cation:dicarboxylate symporter family transporter [Desulfurococcus amylolyticus]|uniref:cation:dicarboxylate symporter family transporter n=1 Tax=Desulfurococcus amylolyticus TaxID=94694 RepID=UPI0006622913|nr:cation:dicarboxylase symporter family transporter [Desulfurococcus amylolyticus]
MSSGEAVFQIRLGKRPILLLVAAILGLITGVIVGEPVKNISILGDIYVSLLKFIVGPLVFLSIAWAVMTMSDLVKLGKIFMGFLPYWLVMGLLSAWTAYMTGSALRPGEGVQLPGGGAITPASLTITELYKKHRSIELRGYVPQHEDASDNINGHTNRHRCRHGW